MKIKQLYRTVCLLGFGMTGERIPLSEFLSSVNMALDTLNSVCPLVGKRLLTVGRKSISDGIYSADVEDLCDELITDTGIAECRTRIARAWFDGGKVYIPMRSFSAWLQTSGELEIILKYYRRATHETEDTFEQNHILDVNAAAEHLLPYLVASTVWADAEPELAQVYREFYETHLKEIDTGTRLVPTYSSPWLPWLAESV